MKTMPREDSSSSSKAIVSGGFGSSTATTATTGRLPFPLLTRTNYAAWTVRMKFILRTNSAWGVIDRGNKPTNEVVDEVQDQLALSIISQSVDDETLRSMHVGVERVRGARVQSL